MTSEITDFGQMESEVLRTGTRCRVVLCGSHDEPALSALVRARRAGIAQGILVGDAARTRDLLAGMGEPESEWTLLDEHRESRIARESVRMLKEGQADVPMKGGVQSSSFLMALSTPGMGIVEEGALLNEATVLQIPGGPDATRLIVAGDCAITIAPTLGQKRQIALNLAELARSLVGGRTVRVAAISVLEKVNPQIVSSVDAAALAAMTWPDGIVVQGPLALDNALDHEAAVHKGVEGEVAGRADVLLVPTIEAGNVLHKSAHFLGRLPMASVVLGAPVPVVMTSRTDEEDTKYHSILAAVHASLSAHELEAVR